jgi:hypothetical protein
MMGLPDDYDQAEIELAEGGVWDISPQAERMFYYRNVTLSSISS